MKKNRKALFLGLTWLDLVGLAIILSFRFIPAPAPLTKEGMQVIGTLLGIAFIYCTVGNSWGTFLAWLCLAQPAKVLMESKNGLNSIMQMTLGDNIVAFVLISLMLCHALKTSGFMDQFSYWFLNRKFATKGPWNFFLAWMLLAFIFGLFIETIPLCIFLLNASYAIFERAGYKKGDKFPSCVVIATVFSALCAYVGTPLVVGGGFKAMSVAEPFLEGGTIPMLQYSMAAAPALILTFFFIYFLMRYLIKPDTSKMEGANFQLLLGQKPEPMSKKGLYITIIYGATMFFWILPNFLDMIAPDWAFTAWCGKMGTLGFALIALTLMFLIKVENKPLLNMGEAFKGVPWGIICVMATTRAIATLLAKDGTGFKAWISMIVESVSGISPWLIVSVICLLCAVATQIASNTPVYTIAIAALVPQAALLGMPGAGIAVMISAASGLALTLPSGFAFLSYLVGDEWCINTDEMKVGSLAVTLHFILCISLTYFLTTIIF